MQLKLGFGGGKAKKKDPILGYPEKTEDKKAATPKAKVSKKAKVGKICCDIFGRLFLLYLVGYSIYSLYDCGTKLNRYLHSYQYNGCHGFSFRDGRIIPWSNAQGDTETEAACKIQLVESIPQGLDYKDGPVETMRTYEAFESLIGKAEHSIQIASSYWSLRGSDTNAGADKEWTIDKGETVYKMLVQAATVRGIKIQIAQDLPKPNLPSLDTIELAKLDNVEVKTLNFTHLIGNGILHTKMMLVDGKHFYVGSNNFDWRSFTQVKEMGVLVNNCPKLSNDMAKIFDIYWAVGGANKTIPKRWPAELETQFNRQAPLKIDSMDMSVYLSATPMQFRTCNRYSDELTIWDAIDSAEKFVYIAVMDYFPTTIYVKDSTEFWPYIDDKLREAAIEKGIEVRLLISNWPHTRDNQKNYLRSLTALNQPEHNVNIQGRWFTVPANKSQAEIPFARVNHNKYIVTDKEALVMTSNWSADYFLYTGGIGFWFSPNNDASTVNKDETSNNVNDGKNMLTELQQVFLRDWNSRYASQNV